MRVVESVARVNASYRSPRESHLVEKTVVKTVSVFSNVRANHDVIVCFFPKAATGQTSPESRSINRELWVKRPFRSFRFRVPFVSRFPNSTARAAGAETLDAT